MIMMKISLAPSEAQGATIAVRASGPNFSRALNLNIMYLASLKSLSGLP